MSYIYLRIEDAPPCRIITLDAPRRRNALSYEVIRELQTAIAETAGARVLVIASAGEVFSSGHDLRQIQAEDCTPLFQACEELMLSLQSLPVPVIAEVDGVATAAGCQLVAACDLAVASDRSSFATPGVRIGLFCSTPMVPLVRAIGRKRAMEMLLTGMPIDAHTALAWGLVNKVTPSENLRECTLTLAGGIAAASATTVAAGKHTFYETVGRSDRDAYLVTTAAMIRDAGRADAREGISAFLEKRPPVWPEPVDD